MWADRTACGVPLVGGPGGIQLVTHPKSQTDGSGSTPKIRRATDHRSDRPCQKNGDGDAVTPPSPIQSACIPSSIPPSSAQAALAFVQIRSGKPCFSPRGTVCPSEFARDHVPPMLSPKGTAKNGASEMHHSFIIHHGVSGDPSRLVLLLLPRHRLTADTSVIGVIFSHHLAEITTATANASHHRAS